jgi:hypothetical protein
VIEVLAAGAHPADVERQEGLDAGAACVHIVAQDDGHGGRNVEAGQVFAAARFGKARLHLRLVGGSVVRGREDNRQPAVGDLSGQFDIFRADGGQVDRQVAAPVDDALERLAQPGGVGALVRNLVMLAVMDERRLAGEDGLRTMLTYSRVLPSGLP